MSANLNYNKERGTYSFASAKEIAWHREGQIMLESMDSETAIRESNLDFIVNKAKLYAHYGNPININGKDITLRLDRSKSYTFREDTGDLFAIVGSDYEIFQNTEVFKFFDSIVGEKKAIYETAGALGNGETIFVTAKLPYPLVIGKTDLVDQYLLMTSSHDGSASVVIKYTPIRVVCNNTLTAALNSGKYMFKFKHTKNMSTRVENAAQLLHTVYATGKEMQQIYNQLAQIHVTKGEKENFILNTFLTKEELKKVAVKNLPWSTPEILSTRKINQLKSIFKYDEVGPGQNLDICVDTAYGLYNTITGYFQNVKKYSSEDDKFSNLLLGADGNIINKALSNLVEAFV
jgi:phage/plasmid-like protein (TIGR03299 family)